MKVEKKTTLADKIAGILNTAPSSFDPEDDAVDATNAQVLHVDVEDTQEDEEILSKFRRANVDLLSDVDQNYAGKKTSRKNFKDSDSDEVQSEDIESGDDDDGDNDIDDDEDVGDEFDKNAEGGSEVEGTSNDEEESIDDEEEDDDELSENDDEELIENDFPEDANFKHITKTNVSNQIKKGVCVRNQMAMWENLLEARIQLQKCLLTANKMPQKATVTEIKKETNSEFVNKVNETKGKLCSTLDKLLLLQKLLLRQFPETKNLGQQRTTSNSDDNADDEEIPSDTDNEQSAVEEEEEEAETTPATTKTKKRKLEEYEHELSDQHKKYKDYRNTVIQKWNDKTRVVVKGDTTSHSVLDQIEYNLSNKEKLLKRTQMKRSQYSILGEELTDDKVDNEYNTEIFDDDDFYHQLLRELIEVKSADVTDPVQLGRQWIQLQSMRSKMKRKVDTRATKGRKIRYAVHSKLVNFMAPIDENLWTDEAKNELYNSLFGKNQQSFNV